MLKLMICLKESYCAIFFFAEKKIEVKKINLVFNERRF